MSGDAPLPQHGNQTTHNLETVLQTNIENSLYYKGLFSHEFNDLVDEIYNEVRVRACPPTLGHSRTPALGGATARRVGAPSLTRNSPARRRR